MTKLVLWLGGPEAIETGRFHGQFFCPEMTNQQWEMVMATFKGQFDDVDEYIPLEVDE